jgi:hypothetical protein
MAADYPQVISISLPYSVWEKLIQKGLEVGYKNTKLYISSVLTKHAEREEAANITMILDDPAPDVYVPIFTDPNEAIEFRFAQVHKIADYFTITEQGNFQAWRRIADFVDILMKKGQLGNFFEQFEAYKKIREYFIKPPPSINRFLGSEMTNFSGGEWCRENWVTKLKFIRENERSKKQQKSKSVDQDYKQRILDRLGKTLD